MLPQSVVEAEAQVRDGILAPSVVGPEVMAMLKSVPDNVSISNRTAQSGFVSDDISAANVVWSSA